MNIVVTFYCHCALCCGEADQFTASGAWPRTKHTIAAPKWISFGTKVVINGITYTVEDRTKSKRGWDIYVSSHSEALKLGRQKVNVTILP